MKIPGSLEKMEITAYKKSNFKDEAGSMSVAINPEKYTHDYAICYKDTQPQGAPSGTPELYKVKSEEIDFQLVFDATGAVPGALPGVPSFFQNGTNDRIQEFLDLVFEYDGSIHSPKYIKLNWGTLIFFCRLTSLKMNYTLFRPDGTPLRATADARFREFTNKVKLAKMANTNSPDLTHVRTVVAGETLPLMCYEIYGSSRYYPQIAAANKLTDFRDLKVGSTVVFPPLGGDT